MGAVAEHVAAIADVVERAEADVETIGEETESGEEAEEESRGDAGSVCKRPHDERRDDAKYRSGPGDKQRTRILSQVGARDFERMENDFGYVAAGDPGSNDVTGLVNGLHSEPRGEKCGAYQNDLMHSVHYLLRYLVSGPPKLHNRPAVMRLADAMSLRLAEPRPEQTISRDRDSPPRFHR